ncbi:aldose 1-epimerase [Shinella sp. CPCC 101442]|uniref:aldose 1-epimerase n=1 Tax=Shinella sp. CPCC 101442 TaxID=2932265 RepID=UPI002152C6F9|nr:aldose 1-epimerase [Shinella sp. CPCC 101442]MCR6497559.1 aldose 1-epimerase [Shinella sp. CPCC 101442]
MTVSLSNGRARITVRPDLGAGLAAFDVLHGADWQPIFRAVDPGTAHPFALSNILLVPFSGRVSGGGFSFNGDFHALSRNMDTEAYPLHGSGFSSPWRVAAEGGDFISLALAAEGPGPFRFDATATYRLVDAGLVMTLDVTNRAAIRLPYGAGFHPWFVRDADTTLAAAATDVWLEQADHLSKGREPVGMHPDMDFNRPRLLPARWINNWFDGWNGKARIAWPGKGLAADIETSEPLNRYVVFSPAADADFICFEPVTHPVDAFNLPGEPQDHGLRVLEPAESLSVSMRITVCPA